MNYGQRLRSARVNRGWSRQTLRNKIHLLFDRSICIETIRRIENTGHMPSETTKAIIIKILPEISSN